MTPPDGRIGIVGLGLIGGSVAARVATTWPRVRVLAVDAPDVVRAGLARGLVHEQRARVEDLGDVDLIILATPIDGIQAALERLASASSTAVITDVGSTKRAIMATAESVGLTGFVGGHPMAGLETAGLESARADLFEDRVWALVPGSGAASETVGHVERFVRGLGARPHQVDADLHDRVVAYASHLPQLIAVALMRTVGDRCGEDGLQLAGLALGEMTRLAASPAGLWEEILRTNADCVAEACREFAARLPHDARALTARDEVAEAFEDAGYWRARLSQNTDH